MDSNNFKEYSTDVMPQANGSDQVILHMTVMLQNIKFRMQRQMVQML